MARLITTSLVGSIEWFLTCPDSWKQSAYTDLVNALSRAPWTPSIAIKKGIDFENTVYNVIETKRDVSRASDNFRFFVDKCQGAKFQNKNKMFEDIQGDEYCLYVKEDAFWKKGSKDWPDGHIKDLKTTKKWGGKDKYLNTLQHELYCLVEEIPTFEYLVAVWEDANDVDNLKIKSVHSATYVVDDFAALRKRVLDRISCAISAIKADEELWSLYLKKFCLY